MSSSFEMPTLVSGTSVKLTIEPFIQLYTVDTPDPATLTKATFKMSGTYISEVTYDSTLVGLFVPNGSLFQIDSNDPSLLKGHIDYFVYNFDGEFHEYGAMDITFKVIPASGNLTN